MDGMEWKALEKCKTSLRLLLITTSDRLHIHAHKGFCVCIANLCTHIHTKYFIQHAHLAHNYISYFIKTDEAHERKKKKLMQIVIKCVPLRLHIVVLLSIVDY